MMLTKVLGNTSNFKRVFFISFFTSLHLSLAQSDSSAIEQQIDTSIEAAKIINQAPIQFKSFKDEDLQFNGKLYKVKSEKGKFQIKLPNHLKNATNLLHSGEANTSTLSLTDSILIDSNLHLFQMNLVSFFTEKNMAELFHHDTLSIRKDYDGQVLFHSDCYVKKQFSKIHVSKSEMDGLFIYSMSFYFHGKKKNKYFLITNNLICSEAINEEILQSYLLFYYKSIESFKIK